MRTLLVFLIAVLQIAIIKTNLSKDDNTDDIEKENSQFKLLDIDEIRDKRFDRVAHQRMLASQRRRQEGRRRRVQEETRRMHVRQRRRQEENRRLLEAQRRKQEERRRRMQEEYRRLQETQRRQQEEKRRRLQEEQRKQEEAQRRKQEEQRRLQEAERRKQEEQRRLQEAQRRQQEEAQRRKQEEQRRKQEEQRRLQEAERRKQEEAQRRKQEEQRKLQEAQRRKQEEQRRLQEAERRKQAEERRRKMQEEQWKKLQEQRRKQEEIRRKQQEEIERQRKLEEEKRRKQQEAERKKIEEEAERRRIEEELRKQAEEKKRKEEEERHRLIREEQEKEVWIKRYLTLKERHGLDDKEFWELIEDDKTDHYSAELKEKILAGLDLKPYEEDKFENEFGRYKERKSIAAIDIISSINYANDLSNLDEGDIVKKAVGFDYKTGERVTRSSDESWEIRKRDARRDRVYLWLDRTVYYEIDATLAESEATIKSALAKIQQISCIKFVEKGLQPVRNWVKFVKKIGCWSMVGRMFWTNGGQELSLGNNCMYQGIIIHEMMHALGFWHEQSRPDRDNYVEIFWENIRETEHHNFIRYNKEAADLLKSEYDFGSIMHYGKYSFAKDAEKPTLVSIRNPNTTIYGQRDGLSETDIRQLNLLYNCENRESTGWSNWSEYGPCDKNCKRESMRFCKNKNRASCTGSQDKGLLTWGIDSKKMDCSPEECNAPVDGHWNRWGSWGDCSASCGNGFRKRTRDCSDPAPKKNGKKCKGKNVSVKICKLRSCSAGLYDCSFEMEDQPFCTWKNSITNDVDWKILSGKTPTSGTGPANDHTTGSGNYVYMEASAPARPNWKAKLMSADMSPGTRCFTFSYNMYGRAIGRLVVYVKDLKTSFRQNIFEVSGDQLKGWKNETFDISAENNYQVIIEAMRGNSFQGDIAIDDVIVKNGPCNTVKPTLKPNKIPTVTRVGCFHSKGYINGKRLFPKLKNLREGNYLRWGSIETIKNSTRNIVQLCAAFAKAKNFEYFGIEFWGECWTGPTSKINYSRDGEAEDCWPKKSENIGPSIVGKDYTVMVYKWIMV